MSKRTLKIEATGDFWRGKVKPMIRLCGHWLAEAGFRPGDRVELTIGEAGTITLRSVTQQQVPL